MPQITSNLAIEGSKNRPIVTDVYRPQYSGTFPLVIFSHGYKGFKDWGAFSQAADVIAASGFLFVKFNYSHNGGTLEQPIDFPDLEAFGQNNFSIELNDLEKVIDWSTSQHFPAHQEWDGKNIFLLGHSRGGALSILKSAENKKVNKLATWSAPCDFAPRFPEDVEEWKKDGVAYIENQRTGQQMPHYFQFFEDFQANKSRFDIPNRAKEVIIPTLLFHGTNDDTVGIEEGKLLNQWIPNSELVIMPNSDHSYGIEQPHTGTITEDFSRVIDKTIRFFRA